MSRLSALSAWLLVLLLALDLIGSPFHAHGHELGLDGFSQTALHAALSNGDARHARVEADAKAGFAHSIAAVARAPLQLAKWRPVIHGSLHGPQRPVDPNVAIPMSHPGRYGSSERRSISARPHLRPEGRAPPLLHT